MLAYLQMWRIVREYRRIADFYRDKYFALIEEAELGAPALERLVRAQNKDTAEERMRIVREALQILVHGEDPERERLG